jgi:hypothetical protein
VNLRDIIPEKELHPAMMKIHSLLNPCENHHGNRNSESPTPAPVPRAVTATPSTPKRQKVPKDAAIYTHAPVNGPVNFPPHEYEDDAQLTAQHRVFQIYPLGSILEKSARRIPYSSDKKDFMLKTGRDAFESTFS